MSVTKEMSFVDHLEELRWHIVRSVIAVVLITIAAFFNKDLIFHDILLAPTRGDFWTYQLFCQFGDAFCMEDMEFKMQNRTMAGQFTMHMLSAFITGIIVAFPYIFWEFWRFIKPALSPKELKNARGIVFWTSFLFFLGVLFAYYVIAPFTINFFANYTLSPTFENIITISNYYGTLCDLVLGIGLVFELPVVVYFLSRIGLLTPHLMRSKKSYAILIIFVLAAIITPPDMFSIWLVAIPMLILYQISITISDRAYKALQNSKED